MTKFIGNSDGRMATLYLERAAGEVHEYLSTDGNWYTRRTSAPQFMQHMEYRVKTGAKGKPVGPIGCKITSSYHTDDKPTFNRKVAGAIVDLERNHTVRAQTFTNRVESGEYKLIGVDLNLADEVGKL